jgi:hypothetical protein
LNLRGSNNIIQSIQTFTFDNHSKGNVKGLGKVPLKEYVTFRSERKSSTKSSSLNFRELRIASHSQSLFLYDYYIHTHFHIPTLIVIRYFLSKKKKVIRY